MLMLTQPRRSKLCLIIMVYHYIMYIDSRQQRGKHELFATNRVTQMDYRIRSNRNVRKLQFFRFRRIYFFYQFQGKTAAIRTVLFETVRTRERFLNDGENWLEC